MDRDHTRLMRDKDFPSQTSPRRDLRVDTLRGVLLVLITLNHFGAWLSADWWGFHLTWQPVGYVSAAEGFVLVAGYSFALVYARYAEEPRLLWQKARQRALLLYGYHLAMTLGLAAVYLTVPVYRVAWSAWLSPYDNQPLRATLAVVLLVYQPPYLDLLPMYALFLCLSPLILIGLHRGHTSSLFAASLALWGLGQVMPPLDSILTGILPAFRVGDFNVCSWQVLYVVGLWLGFTRRQGVSFRVLQHRVLWSFLTITAGALLLSRHAVLFPELADGIDRPTLGWVRLLNVLLLTGLFGVLFLHLPQPQQTPWIAYLGQHSLQVFACHIVLLYALAPVTSQLVAYWGAGGFLLLAIWVVSFLHVPAFLHDHYKAWMLSMRSLSVRT
jgi:hypothetical protein